MWDEENEKGQCKRNERKDIYIYDIIFYGESCLPVFLTLRKFDPRETPLSKDCDISIIQAMPSKEVNEAFWKEPLKDRYHKRNVSISLSNFTVECSEYQLILFSFMQSVTSKWVSVSVWRSYRPSTWYSFFSLVGIDPHF